MLSPPSAKSEFRISKSETNPNCGNIETLHAGGFLSFEHLLSLLVYFGFQVYVLRISFSRAVCEKS
jgi:hypothetical protein